MDNNLKIICCVWIFAVVAFIIIAPLILGAEGDYISSFDTSGQISPDAWANTANGVATDGNFIWVNTYTQDMTYKYFMNGTYTGTSWSTAAQPFYTGDSHTDGIYWWTADDVHDEIYRYFINGTYSDWSFDTSGQGAGGFPVAVTTDGNYFWVVDNVQDEVFKYFMNGTYTGTSWDLAGSGNDLPRGITTDGNYFWITDSTDDVVYKYFINGTYVANWNLYNTHTEPVGIAFYGGYFYIAGDDSNRVFKYEAPSVDTCTCAGAGNDWEIDHSDYCNITDACDLTTGTLSFTGTGITRLNSTIKTTNLGDPGATGILKILSNCLIWIKGT